MKCVKSNMTTIKNHAKCRFCFEVITDFTSTRMLINNGRVFYFCDEMCKIKYDELRFIEAL
jgi:ribosomal protein L24E